MIHNSQTKKKDFRPFACICINHKNFKLNNQGKYVIIKCSIQENLTIRYGVSKFQNDTTLRFKIVAMKPHLYSIFLKSSEQ